MTETLSPQYVDDTIDKYRRYINPGLASMMDFAGFHAVEERAQGVYVTDSTGTEYLDFLGGYGVFSLGHAHPKVVKAVQQQVAKIPISSHVLFNRPMAELAEKLAEITPGKLQFTFFCNSGTEAVEGALKLARLATGKKQIIGTEGGFHGKTYGGLSASGREVYRKPFAPLVPEFAHVPFGDLAAAASAISEETAAFIVEPIQGENGVIVPPDEYLPGLRQLCTEHGVLLILDEVQTGFGRTGKLFACQHWGVEPDIMTMAKALGGGVMPIGAFTATADVWKAFEPNPLLHSSTFGGNQLACTAGLAAIDVILTENLPAHAAEMGDELLCGLRAVAEKYPGTITEVRGKGLLIGVEFTDRDIASLVIAGFAQQHILAAYTLNNPSVIRFEPPLIVNHDHVTRVLAAFDDAVAGVMELLEG
ncbi:MAG TPA: aminotransferase class III-fold pyridoxal phosphate-dependent enzyme [Armatimonadota bacterium]|nr:aminotransferase class III-fold pyridoxal phosphate-dependent enzyme [Armatimonadota bacterium]